MCSEKCNRCVQSIVFQIGNLVDVPIKIDIREKNDDKFNSINTLNDMLNFVESNTSFSGKKYFTEEEFDKILNIFTMLYKEDSKYGEVIKFLKKIK